MKKTIALMLAMLFAVCAFATTAFADETTTTTTTTTTQNSADDDVTDGFDTTTTTEAADDTTTTTVAASDTSTTSTEKSDDATTTSTVADVTATLAPGQTAYEGQGDENKTTTKKPAAVDTTIPSTGSGIVVPAIALAVLAAGTVAVIKTKKDD